MSVRFRSYAEAVRYLDSFVSYEKSPPPKYCPHTYYNLDRFRALLEAMGRPERSLRCIHIAGTDGKGSTAVFLASLLHACGHRVGLYTSPHLFHYTERIQINGRPIPRGRFTQLFDRLARQLGSTGNASPPPPFFSTAFELLTAAAFQYFHEEQVDFAVIETGLGGLLDATNVLDPVVSVLTPVDREHRALLGKTLRAIATQKAGIIKPGRPLFTARQPAVVGEVIRATCLQQGSSLFRLGDYLRVSSIRPSLDGYRFRLYPPGQAPEAEIVSPLLGRHQVYNLSLALLVAQYVLGGCPAAPSPPGADLLTCARRCLQRVCWPGRAEVHTVGNRTWVLDSAHSPQAARSLRRLLDDLFPGRTVHHLLAVSSDKAVPRLVKPLFRAGDSVSCYQSSHPRALDRTQLLACLRRCSPDIPARLGPPPPDWHTFSFPAEGLFCASGSLFWIADVKLALHL